MLHLPLYVLIFVYLWQFCYEHFISICMYMYMLCKYIRYALAVVLCAFSLYIKVVARVQNFKPKVLNSEP